MSAAFSFLRRHRCSESCPSALPLRAAHLCALHMATAPILTKAFPVCDACSEVPSSGTDADEARKDSTTDDRNNTNAEEAPSADDTYVPDSTCPAPEQALTLAGNQTLAEGMQLAEAFAQVPSTVQVSHCASLAPHTCDRLLPPMLG